MKLQKLFSVLWMVLMLVGFGLTQVKAQTPEATPEKNQDQAKPKHKHKKAMADQPTDVESQIQALQQQNQALQDRWKITLFLHRKPVMLPWHKLNSKTLRMIALGQPVKVCITP